MAIKPILRMGDPRLLAISAPVREFGTPALLELIADMNDTMLAANGAGLAAPQIGTLQRVVIFGGGVSARYPDVDAVPYTVLINPEGKIIYREAGSIDALAVKRAIVKALNERKPW